MKSLKFYIIIGIIFVSILGTLFHFVYEWSGKNILVGLFTPINESIWEHTKLIFFPMLIYSFYLTKKIRTQYPCITSAMILSAFLGILLIIVLFYTYSGITGFHIAIIDILIFYISVLIAFYFAYILTISCRTVKYINLLQIFQVIIIGLFIFFTFYQPNIPLFINPCFFS